MTAPAAPATTIPLIVLGGRDRKPAQLPATGRGKHPLRGYKGVDLRIGDQPLIQLVIERMRASGAFDPIFIAGPIEVYRKVCPEVAVIDTDSNFGANLRNALEVAIERCPDRPVAITTCDILPDPEELQRMLADYRQHQPADFWFPLILVPKDPTQLGASAWKPQYRVIPESGGEPVAILPCHLVIVTPAAVRRELVYHVFDLAYRSRNRSIAYRRAFILHRLLFWLVLQDLRNLLRLRPPTYLVTVIYHGLRVAQGLMRRTMSQVELQDRMRKIYIRYRHRRRYPHHVGRVPLLDAISFAKDIDTEEEAQEALRQWSDAAPGPTTG